MSTKRKVTVEAVPSPKAKRVQSTTQSAKKRLLDDTVDHYFNVKESKKKKAAVAAVIEVAPTISSENIQTPKRGRPSNKIDKSFVESSEVIVKSETKKSATKSARKSTRVSLQIVQSESQASSVKSAITPKKVVVKVETEKTTLTKTSTSSVTPAVYRVEGSDTLINFWDHLWDAMVVFLHILTPIFVSLSLGTYLIANLSVDPQPVASVGVAFFMTYCILFIAFVVLIIPTMLLSNLFTDLVTSSFDKKAKWAFQRDLHHYTTFIALFALFVQVSVAYIYGVLYAV